MHARHRHMAVVAIFTVLAAIVTGLLGYSVSKADAPTVAPSNVQLVAARATYHLPINRPYVITQGFSGRHPATDFAVPRGRLVYAVAWGTVISVRRLNYSYGTHVLVRHANGQVTLYAHLNSTHKRVGQRVNAGWAVGRSGSTGHSTGPHLHFEVRNRNGSHVNPIGWLRARGLRP